MQLRKQGTPLAGCAGPAASADRQRGPGPRTADASADASARAVTLLRTAWSGAVWWPVWLGVAVGVFLLREVWALASGRSQDTLSYWVWTALKVTRNESPSVWSATDFLVFGAWMTLILWLTFHFFLRRFT
jgi:hypothetical protein